MLTSMPNHRLPLNTLPAFRAVARLENLRAAAEELNLTHSAVSQQLKLLEEQLGFALFDRRGRRIALNAAGAALLRAVEPALALLDDGMRAAAAAASGAEHRIRVTLLPSFAQRWLLPRMARWRERNPHIGIELFASQQVLDLKREGFHAALRQGGGEWKGLASERLIDSPLIAIGSPNAAHRLLGRDAKALADEPLLGSASLWARWFELAGLRVRVNPVAAFNDAGLMLQAAEQGLGLALARELLAADAICDGKLVRLSPLSLPDDEAYAYWLVYPPDLRDWPPLVALRDWLREELTQSQDLVKTPPMPLR
ncbi:MULTISPECIES: LysR substrate-binding domain-containing protein [unclassified Rhizobacter]|uniref:LysR substrate-binding domain-containing protein n=1 Tax=unclassified Rhizobacter TaxID=2640088 RepID=UPI0006FB516D|nr:MULTISPECIES: LysR substrate-binding domain-containing protein [unclassified Rhizobacter]KQU80369.1 LysR family transcriptional regulator [Rhizobacter sp. Root29]KQW13867.1 LysR family transcriptional regulator [Rhizobacter sp. Root1238]KRB20399.1 LysR family transcriptional regulator [Rhizobacter sp. Root16D2]